MRKILLLSMLTLLASAKMSFSQAPNLAAFHLMDSLNVDTNQTPENYFKLMDSVVTNLYPDDSSEGSSRNQYRRFKQFYKSRMPTNSGNTNLFRAYAEGLEAALTLDEYNCGDEETFRGNWTNIGPKDLDDHQNGGYVTDVWVDPTDDTKRLIATEGGGVWKWNNTDTKWENISDNIHHTGTIGIISMAVNPLNPDDIYIATQPRGAYRDGAIYGMGVWHTTDGGDNWQKETSLPDADFFFGTELKFSPYLVNNQPYIILTSVNNIFAKLGNGNWQLLASISGTNFGPVTNLNEIEFASDMVGNGVGTFFLASNWGYGGNFTTGVWQIDFNTTTGAISGSPTNVIDLYANNMTISTALHGTLTGANISQCYALEYVGGGKFFIGMLPLYNNANYIGPPDWEMIVIEWNLSSPTTCTTIINGITNIQGGQCALQLEVPNNTPNIMYLGKTQANIIYKESNVWKWKAISNYLADLSEIHPDIRKIYIQSSQNNALKPGYDDVVYWCTDGGLAKTTLHDIGEIVTPNNFTLDPLELGSRVADNMNDIGVIHG